MWITSVLSAISKVEALIAFGAEEQYGSTKKGKPGLPARIRRDESLHLKTRGGSRKNY